MCVPIAYLIDVFINEVIPSFVKIIAIAVLMVGYLVLNLAYAGYDIGPKASCTCLKHIFPTPDREIEEIEMNSTKMYGTFNNPEHNKI